MATAKKLYVNMELEWAERQLEQWKDYVEAHPLATLKDRIGQKPTKNGGMMPYVIASIEQQGTFVQKTMENYIKLLVEVNRMREVEEEKKIKARGVDQLSPFEDGTI
jgi:hypothetical protein